MSSNRAFQLEKRQRNKLRQAHYSLPDDNRFGQKHGNYEVLNTPIEPQLMANRMHLSSTYCYYKLIDQSHLLGRRARRDQEGEWEAEHAKMSLPVSE